MLRSRSDCGRVRRPMRQVVLLALASLLLVTSGCKSQCRLLSEKACDCTVNSNDRTGCLQRAATQEGAFPPDDKQEDLCEELIAQCDCRLVDTAAGKMRCGLAY